MRKRDSKARDASNQSKSEEGVSSGIDVQFSMCGLRKVVMRQKKFRPPLRERVTEGRGLQLARLVRERSTQRQCGRLAYTLGY